MWQIEDAVQLDERAKPDTALSRIQSDLAEMAHTQVSAGFDQVGYATGRARWWMGGRPFDNTESGTFFLDRRSGILSVRVKMKRAFFCYLIMGIAVSAVASIALDVPPVRAAVYGLLGFGWLWGVNYFLTRRGISNYLRAVSQAA